MFINLPEHINDQITDYLFSSPKINIFGLNAFFQKNHHAIRNMTFVRKFLNLLISDKIIKHVMQEIGIVLNDGVNPWLNFKNQEDFLLNLALFVNNYQQQISDKNFIITPAFYSNPVLCHLHYLYSNAALINYSDLDQTASLYNAIQLGSVSSYYALISLNESNNLMDYEKILKQAKEYLITNYNLILTQEEETCFYKSFGYNLSLGIEIYKNLQQYEEFKNNDHKHILYDYIARLVFWFYQKREGKFAVVYPNNNIISIVEARSIPIEDKFSQLGLSKALSESIFQTIDIIKNHFLLGYYNPNELKDIELKSGIREFFGEFNKLIKTIQSTINTVSPSETYFLPLTSALNYTRKDNESRTLNSNDDDAHKDRDNDSQNLNSNDGNTFSESEPNENKSSSNADSNNNSATYSASNDNGSKRNLYTKENQLFLFMNPKKFKEEKTNNYFLPADNVLKFA